MKKYQKSIKTLQTKSAQVIKKEQLQKVKGGSNNFVIEDDIM